MPIDINDAFINAQFQNFVDFARGKGAGTKVRALIGNDGPERTVGAKSESVLNKIFFRVPSNKAVNNEVRTLFRAAVARMFGGEEHIPASVKTAMKLGDYGKGRPLTARRILAVRSALEEIAAKHDDFLQRGLDNYGERADGAAADRVKVAYACCHGNADAMDVVDKHLGTILETGEGDLRSEQEVRRRVEGLVANLAQLKALSRKNAGIYVAGRETLVILGKPVPRDILAGLVQAANRAPLNLFRRLDAGSRGMEIHKAVRQFYDILQAALDSSGAAKKYAAEPDAKTTLRAFAGMVMLSRCSAAALGRLRDALNAPTTAHLYRLYSRYRNGETDGVPRGGVSVQTLEGLKDAGEIAGNFLEMLAYCVHENLIRVTPGATPVEIGSCNGIPDLEALGGDALVEENLSLARAINAQNVDAYLDATVKGQGRAADEARRIVRNKLGECNDPLRSLGSRLGANAAAMLNITVCGEMQKLAAGQASQFEQDLAHGIDATLQDGDRTIKLSNDFATARDQLARFVTGDDTARYETLPPPARGKVHLLMALLSQKTEKAGENGIQYAVAPEENQPIFDLGTPPRGTGRATRTFTIEKKDNGGIDLLYEVDKQINSFEAHDQPGENLPLAPESSIKSLLGYSLAGNEFNRLANLDYTPYNDDQVSSRINETETLPNGTVACKPHALFRALDAMPEPFRIQADCTLDFELNLVPAQDA